MSITRQKQLLELALISQAANTNPQVKAALEITDFDPAPILLDISNLQGDVSGLQSDVSGLETDISGLETDVAFLSGAIDNIEVDFTPLENAISDVETFSELVSNNAEIDMNNLDISFTTLIATQCLRADTPVVTGSSTTVNGFVEVNINGITYKLATIA